MWGTGPQRGIVSGVVKGACLPCKVAKCTACAVRYSECQGCDDGFYLKNNQCLPVREAPEPSAGHGGRASGTTYKLCIMQHEVVEVESLPRGTMYKRICKPARYAEVHAVKGKGKGAACSSTTAPAGAL